MKSPINHQKQLDNVINTLGGRRPRLLLHACCAPCTSYVLEYLMRYFDIDIFFINPNIQPEEEYEKRLYWMGVLLTKMSLSDRVRLLDIGWRGDEFTDRVRGLESEPEGSLRCSSCFRLRLGKTAELASDKGYDYFCSTLTVSPHKNSRIINEIGQELSREYSVPWLPSDFKKREGYKRSIALSREYGLYRQDYCGCLFGKD